MARTARPALDLSVIVPCLDEALNVGELASRVLGTLDRGALSGELVLVDDGSTDGTDDAIRALETAHPGRVRGVFHPRNRGIAEAWRSGAHAAAGRYVVTLDADLQYQPEDVLRLWRTLHDRSVDVVQGWRSPVGRRKDDRYYLSRGFNALLNGVFGMRLSDNKSGFVLTARETFLDLLSYEGTYAYWQSFVMVAAHAKGYSYVEVETLFEPRRQGQSFLQGKKALVASARSLLDVGRAAWRYRVRRPPPDPVARFLASHPVVDRAPEVDARRSPRWRPYMAAFDRTHWMITRDVERYYDALRQSQWLAPSDLRALQDEKLRALVRHAYRNVPYYRARMQEARVHPDDVRGQDDLHKLPLLSKADVREHLYFDLLSDDHDKAQVLKITTSGSTGEPFVCFADRAQLEIRWAATLRSQEWTGYRFGDPTVRLWHQTLGMSRTQAAQERLDALLSNRSFVPVFELSDARLREAVELVASVGPTLLDGYAEALDLVSRWIVAHPEHRPRIGAVMSSAQTLPEASRRLIEEAFGCRVFDKYGAREFSGIAYECEAHDGHHVVGEAYVVEVLRDGRPARPGELGEVVITDLNNRCMPFLRYRLGDLAVARDPAWACACGRGLPRIGDIEGRVQSIVRGTNGAYLPGTFFAHYLKELDHAIRRFQVIQERDGAITFRVVKGGRFSAAVLDEVLATFRAHLGADMQIDVAFVDDVEMVRTGKIVPVVSHLGLDFQRSAPPHASTTLRAHRSDA